MEPWEEHQDEEPYDVPLRRSACTWGWLLGTQHEQADTAWMQVVWMLTAPDLRRRVASPIVRAAELIEELCADTGPDSEMWQAFAPLAMQSLRALLPEKTFDDVDSLVVRTLWLRHRDTGEAIVTTVPADPELPAFALEMTPGPDGEYYVAGVADAHMSILECLFAAEDADP